jgi:hypothetical protein
MADPELDLAYGIAPPTTVDVTVDPAHKIKNTIEFNIMNPSTTQIAFNNPEGLTPDSELPPYGDDSANPLDRLYVWFDWGTDPGDFSTDGDAINIRCASMSPDWAASNPMSDPLLGTYWTVFPMSQTVLLGPTESVVFEFTRIVSELPADQNDVMTMLYVEPRVAGYAQDQSTVELWKVQPQATATLSASKYQAEPGAWITLSWTATGASSCSLTPGNYGSLPEIGTQDVQLPAAPSTTYTLTATPDGGGPVAAAQSTITTETGWVNIGRNPWGWYIGPLLYTLPDRLVFLNGDGSAYSSLDGSAWEFLGGGGGTLPVAPFYAYFAEQLWFMGGAIAGDPPPAPIMSSPDGVTWTTLTEAAPWGPRSAGGTAVFADALWVVAGKDVSGGLNDVWSSPDGSSWTQTCAAAPWSARSQPGVATFDGRLWMCGGLDASSSSGATFQDSWSSADGVDWEKGPTVPWAQGQVAILVATDDVLYAISLTPSLAPMQLWQMDLTGTWTQVTPLLPFDYTEYHGWHTPFCNYDGYVIAAGLSTWQYSPPPSTPPGL